MPERLEANAEHLAVALSDLNMLRGPGGQERTGREYGELLRDGGFKIGNVYPAGRFNVIETTVL
jgi:hypothetical protein